MTARTPTDAEKDAYADWLMAAEEKAAEVWADFQQMLIDAGKEGCNPNLIGHLCWCRQTATLQEMAADPATHPDTRRALSASLRVAASGECLSPVEIFFGGFDGKDHLH
jgi:hypothetical protein